MDVLPDLAKGDSFSFVNYLDFRRNGTHGDGSFRDSLFADSQQHRMAILIEAAFSLAASLLVIISIAYDSYRGKVEHDASALRIRAVSPPHISKSRNMMRSTSILRPIHSAEVIPFIIAISAVAQEGIIIGVQSAAIFDFTVEGCRLTAELLFPAIWLLPITSLVFGCETTFRSIRRDRFRPRGRPDVAICVASVAIVLLALWLTTFFWPMSNQCIGSLVWWTLAYNKVAVVLAGCMILTFLVCMVVTTIQLLKTVKMNSAERVAASRVVYSMGIAASILAMILPFYLQLLLRENPEMTSRLADMAPNLGGLLNAALHVVLRTNTDRLAIRAKDTPWVKRKKMRLFGPNDLNAGMMISSPLTLVRTESNAELVEKEKTLFQQPRPSPEKPRSASRLQYVDAPNASSAPALTLAPPPKAAFKNPAARPSYSLFPVNGDQTQVERVSWARSSPTDASYEPSIVQLPPPPPLHASRHIRNGSSQSSSNVTIQVGLRLSHAPTDRATPESIDLPLQSTQDLRPSGYFGARQYAEYAPPTNNQNSLQVPRSAARWQTSRPGTSSSTESFQDTDQQYVENHRMKSLPPVPLQIPHKHLLPGQS